MIPQALLNRKGARKFDAIPPTVLTFLNKGVLETVNLTEWLAVDQIELVHNTFGALELAPVIEKVTDALSQLKNPSTMKSIQCIGQLVYAYSSENGQLARTFQGLSNHTSDTVRCYATYLIALNENLTLSEKLNQAKALVSDHHFGVREVVWMALRPTIEASLPEALTILTKWAKDSDENIRRFTTESTRPRGVWCKHIEALKNNPKIALPLLNTLKADPSKYVQDSVGNWLNDASKSAPQFVIDLCDKWQKESPTKATEKIIKRARRTIDKKK